MHWPLFLALLPSLPLTIWLARRISKAHPVRHNLVWFFSSFAAMGAWYLCGCELGNLVSFYTDATYGPFVDAFYGASSIYSAEFGLAGLSIALGNFAVAAVILAILSEAK